MKLASLKPEDLEFFRDRSKHIWGHIDRIGAVHGNQPGQLRDQKIKDRMEAWGAELAIARWAGVPYEGEKIGDYGAPDVGYWGQVKWSAKSKFKLNLFVQFPSKAQKRCYESFAWILTTGLFPNYEMLGWIGGDEMVKIAHIFQNKQNGHKSWRVYQDDLWKDFSTLKLILQSGPI